MSLSSLNSRISAIENQYKNLNAPAHQIKIDFDNYEINFLDGSVYIPSPTAKQFHSCNDNVRLMMGPYGSGKSVACCAEAIFRSAKMPKCNDGVRRTRAVFIRNTYKELKLTTLKTWEEWFRSMGVVRSLLSPPMEYHHRFDDGNGTIELEIIFLALDTEDDIKKLKSLEITFAFINEAKELPQIVLDHTLFRCDRYPAARSISEPYWSGVWMDTNPPDTDSWVYNCFEKGVEGYRIFKQPPGLLKIDEKWVRNDNAENLKNLKNQNYYIKNAANKSDEFVRVYCCGEYGIVLDGKVVYPQYNDDVHAVDDLEVITDNPIIIGFDFGLTPAAALMQLVGSQLRVFKEFTTDRMGIRELAGTIIKPFLSQNYPNYTIISTCDPSGVRGMDTDTSSCLQVLHELGFKTFPANTNGITARIEAVNSYINRMTEGKPAFIISKKGCPNLRKGFLGKYCYKKIRLLGQEKFHDLPDKSHPFSDIQDCVQYGALHCNNGIKSVNSYEDFNYKSSSVWL